MNSISRVILAVILALLTTFGLLYLMHTLINSDLEADDIPPPKKLGDIHMPDTTIEIIYDAPAPDKPPEPEVPPEVPPEPEFDTPEINPDALNMEAPTMDTNIQFGLRGIGGDGEYLPIVKVAPQYPRRAAQRSIEGFCTVQFTVTTTGATRDVSVIPSDCIKKDGSLTTMFNRASVRAAEKFKYKPRVEDGQAIEVQNVKNRFVYEMAQQD